jgi:cardiolipin synthase (CMP-forming)
VNIPNLISLGRLLVAPLAVWLILSHRMEEAFWLFVAAGVSDAVDGFIAKRFNATTTLGSYLDPIADKVLLVSVYVTLGVAGYIPDWLVIMVVFRDGLILGGAVLFYMVTQSISMQPIFISKINTAFQIALATAVLAVWGLHLESELDWMIDVMTWLTAATTLASGAIYVFTWSRRAFALEKPE